MATEMSQEAVSTLNDLIETLKDGKNGFETAASDVKDANVKAIFTQFAQQRSQLASELQSEVRKLGGDPEKSGSVSATMHRGWINIKSALGGGEKSILNEAERGEDVAVRSYEKALQQNLPGDLSSVIRRQYDQVKQAHDRVRDLRDSWK